MLKRLRIENFQKYNKLDLTFTPGINCIVGDTGSGKSAIIRALRWLCLNAPRGTGFIKVGQKFARVKGLFDTHTVERFRQGNTNLYKLDKKEFASFKQDVPEKIQQITGMSDINFQRQHDGPFWFNLNASDVSRELNKIIDLDIIDYATAHASKKHKEFQTKAKIRKEDLKKAREQRNNLKWIIECAQEWHELEKARAEIQELHNEAKELAEAITEIKRLEKTIVEVPNISNLVNAFDKIQEMEHEQQQLSECLAEIQQKKNQIAANEKEIRAAKMKLKTCPTCGSYMGIQYENNRHNS